MKKLLLVILLFPLSSFSQCKLKYSDSKIDETTTITYKDSWNTGVMLSATKSKTDTICLLKFTMMFILEDKPYKDSLDFKLIASDKSRLNIKCKIERFGDDVGNWNCPIQPSNLYFFRKEIIHLKIANYETAPKLGYKKLLTSIKEAAFCISNDLMKE
jgi:hypothetical protein